MTKLSYLFLSHLHPSLLPLPLYCTISVTEEEEEEEKERETLKNKKISFWKTFFIYVPETSFQNTFCGF